jgi:hypothetical protein
MFLLLFDAASGHALVTQEQVLRVPVSSVFSTSSPASGMTGKRRKVATSG